MKKLYGVTVAMVTPIDKNNKVDLEKTKELVELLIHKGVHCIYCCGTDGEMFHLTTEERKKVAETVVKTAKGRVVAYVHCGAMREEDTIALVKHAECIGADGVGVVTPAYFPTNDREMETYYIKVANSVSRDFPVYFYNIPQCTTNDLKPSVAQRIVQRCPNIIGIKYNYANINQTLDYTNINQGCFSVLQGDDRTVPAWLALGCDGTVSGSANVFPEPLIASYNAFMCGDLQMSLAYGKIAARFVDALQGDNIAYFKEALKIRGFDVGMMRPPLLDLTPEQSCKLRYDLELICSQTGIPLRLDRQKQDIC